MPGTIELTKYLDFVSPDVVRIHGHRLGIEHVLNLYLSGNDPEEIADELPGLAIETIYIVIAYYYAHRNEVAAYLERQRARDEAAYLAWAAEPPPIIERLRVVREQRSEYTSS